MLSNYKYKNIMDIEKKIKDRIKFNEQSRINLDFGIETDGVIESENKFLNELLSICIVSHRRELLNSFAEEWNVAPSKKEWIYDKDIESFIKDKTIL